MAPHMARTDIDICNRALARVGSDVQLASLTDNTAEATVCAREYPETFASALTVPGGKPMRWSFATTQKALTRLSTTPVARFAYAWQIEANTLIIHAVLVNSIPIEFTRLDDMIYCDADADVVAEYTFQPDEAALPSFFADALATDLAAKVALGLNRDIELADKLARQAEMQWAAARAADSQARSSRRVRANRLAMARFG
jgi:hypothetical protein